MGSRIRCFLVEPTDRVRQKLRRYSSDGHWSQDAGRTIYDNPCPITGFYHDADACIEEAQAIRNEQGYLTNGSRDDAWPKDDPRWPARCACGYEFQPGDTWQLFCELIYRRQDTGEDTTLRDVPAGAIWRAPWMDWVRSQDAGAPIVVKTPGGEWVVDGHASNCTIPDDHQQERHHCWPRIGEPPDVDVSKDHGPTCQAGAGSILAGSYHGFLRHGYLEEC